MLKEQDSTCHNALKENLEQGGSNPR